MGGRDCGVIRQSSFLIIGGGGSIGQAVCKEIFKRSPNVLHAVDISENNLVELVRDIRSSLGYIIYDNPRNQDVKGISVSEIRDLFPAGNHKVWRLTLAPPLGRLVTKIHPGCYTFFNMFPFLRTHVLCWIRKG